jgi:hypothetical protein
MKEFKAIRMKGEKVNDVAISCDLFRLEEVDIGLWWAAAYQRDKRTSFWIRRKGKEIVVEIQENSLGCIDDTKL